MSDKRWTPVLSKGVYCSPACGGGCTKQQYNAAMELAKRCASKLNRGRAAGTTWEPKVHENLGWYARAVSACGRWEVTVHKYGRTVSYTAFLKHAGRAGGIWAESGDSATVAVANTRRVALAEIKARAALLDLRLVSAEDPT